MPTAAGSSPWRSASLSGKSRCSKVVCLDELGYMELDRRGTELLFQVLTEREEKSAIAIASNEPFSKSHRFAATDARACLNLTGAA
jgi:DNA replication protein DnaC